MARKLRMSVCLALLSTMFGFLGYVFGGAAITGPCSSIKGTPCAFQGCKAGPNMRYYACSSPINLPKCQNQNQDNCDPAAAFCFCTYTTYKDVNCTQDPQPYNALKDCCD